MNARPRNTTNVPATAHNVDTKMPASSESLMNSLFAYGAMNQEFMRLCSYASPAAILSALSIRNVEYFPSDGRLCVPNSMTLTPVSAPMARAT